MSIAALEITRRILISKQGRALLIGVLCIPLVLALMVGPATFFNADLSEADLYYTELEMELAKNLQPEKIKRQNPGFDEYDIITPAIRHSPDELAAYLLARSPSFSLNAMRGTLAELLAAQYVVTKTEKTEVRYRTETSEETIIIIDPITGKKTKKTQTVETEVPYEVHVLVVRVEQVSIAALARTRLVDREVGMFEMYSDGSVRQCFASPFTQGVFLSSMYGWRKAPRGETAWEIHRGVDLAAAEGTPLKAIFDGVIDTVSADGERGNYLIVKDKSAQYAALYQHCQSVTAAPGQKVKKGDVIALCGNTGNSTGPHLHLELKYKGEFVNPFFFVEGMTYNTSGGAPGYDADALSDEAFARLIAEAEKYIGLPYLLGASAPPRFDCSGFVCYVLNQTGLYLTPRLLAQGLYDVSARIGREELKPGDLVFFSSAGLSEAWGRTVTHVGIYVGNGMMIDANNKGVGYTLIDLFGGLYGYGRLDYAA